MFCDRCGTPAEETKIFCSKCGAALRSIAINRPAVKPSHPSGNDDDVTRSYVQFAGRGARLGAVMLDVFILAVCLTPGIIVISISDSAGGQGFGWALIAMGCLALATVQIVLLVKHGQTLGKRALGIRIVRLADESVPGFVKLVLLRQFLPLLVLAIPYVGCLIWLLNVLFIFRADRRCLHDLIAETKVVKV